MVCPTCGAELSPRDDRCAACGSTGVGAAGSGTASPTEAGGEEAAAAHPITFDVARLTRGDRIVGVASLIVFIALFLPWYGTGLIGFTVDGLWHGWMVITLLLTIATTGYVAALAAVEIRLPITHDQALLGATGVTCLLVVIGLVTTPSGATLEWGAVLGVIAAAAAVGGALVRRREHGIS